MRRAAIPLANLRCALAVACATLALAAGGAARAQTPLEDAELAQMRGGFLSLDGFTFDFGAVARTEVNGRLALETRLTLGPEGLGSIATPGDAAGFRAQGLAFAVAPDGTVSLADGTGTTSVTQTLTGSEIRNTVLNTASGRQVTQSTSLNLVLPGFAATQQALALQQLAARLTGAVQSAVGVGR